jgi:hypothetical protein
MTDPTQPEQGIQETPPAPNLSSTAIQEAPASPDVIPLPPLPPIPVPPRATAVHWSAFDVFLLLLATTLAFFLGSFAVTNNDFWLHLATGRAIAQGEHTFGVDPFSFASVRDGVPVPWINHSWLYDVALYGLYSSGGERGVVIARALIMVALLWVLLRFRPSDGSPLTALFFATLAVLAASQLLSMNSTMISYLLLAIVLLLLRRGGMLGELPGEEEPAPKALWGLPLVFLLWVNMDAWFIVGLLILALIVLGNGLGHVFGWRSGCSRTIQVSVLLASAAACVINPFHLRAFVLPPEFAYLLGNWVPEALGGGGGETLRGLMRPNTDLLSGYGGLISPFHASYWPFQIANWGAHFTIVSVSYFVLLLLSIVSFAVVILQALLSTSLPEGAGLSVGRLLAWGLVAILSLNYLRLMPLFAVVAGPITLLNFVDCARWWRRQARDADQRGFNPRLARLAVAMLLLISLGLAWPGWLHVRIGAEKSARRVAWYVREDPSLRAAAETLRQEQAKHVFNYSFDVANYCAWFAPDVHCYVDQRFGLFPHEAADYAKAVQELPSDALEVLGNGRKPGNSAWIKLFRQHKIDHLVLSKVYDNRPQMVVAQMCWLQPFHWTQRYQDGRAMVFAWSAAGQATPVEPTVAWNREAFGPVPRDRRVPPGIIEQPLGGQPLKELYLEGQPPLLSRNVCEPSLELAYFHLIQERWPLAYVAAWRIALWGGPAGLASAAPGGALGPNALLIDFLQLSQREARDLGPPAVPILMIRQARRAVAEAPFEAAAHRALYRAYALAYSMEQAWTHRTNPMGPKSDRESIREAQLTTTLRNCLELDPDNYQLRVEFAKLLYQFHHLDAGLEQLALAQKSFEAQRYVARDRQKLEAYKAQQKDLAEFYKGSEKVIKNRRRDYELTTGKSEPLKKFEVAVLAPYRTVDADNKTVTDFQGMGLTLEGLKQLQSVAPESLKEEQETNLRFVRFRLLLQLGRLNDATTELVPVLDKLPIHESFLWHAAVSGDYEDTDKILAATEKRAEESVPLPKLRDFAVRFAVLQPLQFTNQQPLLPRVAQACILFDKLAQGVGGYRLGAEMRASWRSLRGLCALESGDTAAAQKHFEEALRVAGPQAQFIDRPIAERYLELLREQKKK